MAALTETEKRELHNKIAEASERLAAEEADFGEKNAAAKAAKHRVDAATAELKALGRKLARGEADAQKPLPFPEPEPEQSGPEPEGSPVDDAVEYAAAVERARGAIVNLQSACENPSTAKAIAEGVAESNPGLSEAIILDALEECVAGGQLLCAPAEADAPAFYELAEPEPEPDPATETTVGKSIAEAIEGSDPDPTPEPAPEADLEAKASEGAPAEGDPEDWTTTPIAQLGLSKRTENVLAGSEITTFGSLAVLFNTAGVDWPKSVKGAGAKVAEEVSEKWDAFWTAAQ